MSHSFIKIILRIILSITLLGGCFAALPDPDNLLKNGSFELGLDKKGLPKFWGEKPYEQVLDKKALIGNYCLRIAREDFGYSIGAQIIPLDLPENTPLVIMGYIKGDQILAQKEKWQGGKLQAIFLDGNDQELGQPQDIISARTGSFDWDMFIHNIDVPAKAKKVKILLGLWGAKGKVWFDDLRLSVVPAKTKLVIPNMLSNGDFELWGKWEFLGEGNSEIKYPGYNGSTQALYVKNSLPEWTFARQSINVKNLSGSTLQLSGLVKYTNIIAGKKWEKGRIYVEFFDDRGKQIGGWLELLAVEGSANWTKFKKEFTLPANVQEIKIYFGLQQATGEIVFDDLVLTNIVKE